MTRLPRWFLFLCSAALMFAQPVLRFKVSIDSPAQTYSTDAIGRDDPINRLPRLPLIARTHVIVQFDQPPSAADPGSAHGQGRFGAPGSCRTTPCWCL